MTPGEAALDAYREMRPPAGSRVGLQQLYEELGGPRGGGTRKLLDLLGWEPTKSNYRRIQRYRTSAGQRRNPEPEIQALLDAVGRQRAAGQLAARGLHASFDGEVQVSDDRRHRVRDVFIDPDNPYLPGLIQAFTHGDEATVGENFERAFFEGWGPGLEAASMPAVNGVSFRPGAG